MGGKPTVQCFRRGARGHVDEWERPAARLKTAQNDRHWESVRASSREFLEAQKCRMPTLRRAWCLLHAPPLLMRKPESGTAPLSAFPDREHFKNPTSSFSEPNHPNISTGGIRSLSRRHEASIGMVPSALTKTKGWQKKPSCPLRVAKSRKKRQGGRGFVLKTSSPPWGTHSWRSRQRRSLFRAPSKPVPQLAYGFASSITNRLEPRV